MSLDQSLNPEVNLSNWRLKEKNALELSKIVGELSYDRSIDLILFRRDLIDVRPSELLQAHTYCINYTDKNIDVDLTLAIAKEIQKLEDLGSSRIDIGKLAIEWLQSDMKDLNSFLKTKLANGLNKSSQEESQRDVVLYGFGRIGRLVTRRLIATTGSGQQLRLRAIVIRPGMKDRLEEFQKRMSLLETDSIHGNFRGTIKIHLEQSQIEINGNLIHMIFASDPSEIDYTKYGINNALLIDNTGMWDTKEKLSAHLRPGISQVILTAPGKDIPNIVVGVNQDIVNTDTDKIFCAASCTTNAIVPVIHVIDKEFGIEKGHIETVHAYTRKRKLWENCQKKRRGERGAPINMVITSTGAASAVAKVLPHLKGKLTGNAVRVPVPNVSLAILNLTLGRATTIDEILNSMKKAAYYGDLAEQIQYSSSNEYVSSNAVGSTVASVLDAPSTILSNDGRTVTLYAWYDNEYGYSCQVVRFAKYVAKVRRFTYY